MRVKICGITNVEDALAAAEAGADALGFNFAEEAKAKNRYISPEEAGWIIGELPPFVTTVAVTVNESVEKLREYLEVVDIVQLHGEEPPEICEAVAKRAIKVFRVGADFSPADIGRYRAAAYLLDASVPGARGGTGAPCDWTIARKVTELVRPVILAGGLTPENVAEAVRAVRPDAVDTAGGVEEAPGKKDHERIRHFIQEARNALSR